MTLLVALKGRDGIVAATDSRGTFGDARMVTAQNDTMQKLYAVAPHVALMASGAAELATVLKNNLEQRIGQDVDGASAVMGLTREVAREGYGQWFPGWAIQQGLNASMPVRPDLGLVVTGFDPDPDGAFTVPKIYQLVSALDFAPMLSDYGFALQGVAQYALYLLNRLYVPDSPIADLMALAVYVIGETASQDGKVGGPVQVATITPRDGCAILAAEQVEAIVAANKIRSEQLRSSFFAGASG